MNCEIKLSVIIDKKRNRLDKFLADQFSEFSRSKIAKIISSGGVFVDGNIILDTNYAVKYKQEISISLEKKERIPLSKDSSVKFTILYEDEDIIVVNKPAGVVVHPGIGNYEHTLVNGLAYYYGESLSSGSSKDRPGIVHRIDKDTSGILVIAKNDRAHIGLSKQFHDHSIKRKYICFCYGVPAKLNGRIETLIGRDKRNRLKMAVVQDSGRHAITIYRTLRVFSRFTSKIECELLTGRTHQIRVHMTHIGHSLIGDPLYKAKNYFIPNEFFEIINNFSRQALHAYFLEFTHPISGKIMHFESELPEDMRELEQIFGGIG